MPMALPEARGFVRFSRAMRSRSPRVFAMLTTLLHIYLHVVVDFHAHTGYMRRVVIQWGDLTARETQHAH